MTVLAALRAPREHGALVAIPPLTDVGALFADNLSLLASTTPLLLGRSGKEIRVVARQALLDAARRYLQESGEPLPSPSGSALFLAGHQPELFHPGVWVKNFALHHLARTHGAIPVNLLVDNDLARKPVLTLPPISVPLPSAGEVATHVQQVPWDQGVSDSAWEERLVEDEALFASLPERARLPWNFEPILDRFWGDVVAQRVRTRVMGERFAAARRLWERRWGCHNLEVPVSAVCRTEPFAWFACDLLSNLPRFHDAYNGAVRDYRRRHRLRSSHHPVPDLMVDGDWWETPFWAWRGSGRRRGRLQARCLTDRIDLRTDGENWPSLPRQSPSATVAAWLALEADERKVRSRALTTTLFARLFLSDLFLHGIGGGKYDEVTDDLAQRYYGVTLPSYLVLSATLLLPLPHYPGRMEDVCRLRQQERDLFWNPQRHLEAAPRGLIESRQTLLAQEPPDPTGRRRRFRELRAVTESLRPAIEDQLTAVRHQRIATELEVQVNELLRRRDYAFCLHPEAELRALLEQWRTGEG